MEKVKPMDYCQRVANEYAEEVVLGISEGKVFSEPGSWGTKLVIPSPGLEIDTKVPMLFVVSHYVVPSKPGGKGPGLATYCDGSIPADVPQKDRARMKQILLDFANAL